MDTNAGASHVPECAPGAEGHREFPASEWMAAAEVHAPAMDFAEPPVIVAPAAAAPAPAAPASDTKTVVMVLAMGMALLASQKPETFAWLLHESLAFVPTLVLAHGLKRLERFEQTERAASPAAERGALVLAAAAAAVAVLGVPGA